MKVICIADDNKGLSEKTLAQGYSIMTKFETLEKGKIYFVYGISIWEDVLFYLIIDQLPQDPIWFPAQLFSVVDNALPKQWYFNYYSRDESEDLSAIWGYKELALDYEHSYYLLDGDSQAINIFLKRKKEIEEQL